MQNECTADLDSLDVLMVLQGWLKRFKGNVQRQCSKAMLKGRSSKVKLVQPKGKFNTKLSQEKAQADGLIVRVGTGAR